MKKILVIILFIAIAAPAYGQKTAGQQDVYSLEDCINLALRNNYDIKLSKSQVEYSGARVTQAFGTYLPSISYNLGYRRNLNPEGPQKIEFGGVVFTQPAASPNTYNMSASANYILFDGFQREANYSLAQENLDADIYNEKHTEQSVVSQIYEQYINVIKNSMIIKIRSENLEQNKKELERIQAQYEAGAVPIGSVYAQETELGNRELELVRAENDRNIARAKLLTTMGLPPDAEAEFLESSLPQQIEDDEINAFRGRVGSMRAAINSAFDNRHDYAASESRIEAANSALTAARSGYFPTISASGGWGWSNTEFAQFGELGRSYLSLNFQLPIFDNFMTHTQIQQGQLQVAQEQISQQKLEQDIRSSIQTAMLNLEAAEKSLHISETAVRSAEQNFNSARERLHVGAATITDYIQANTQYVTARINHVNARYDYILARKMTLYSMGVLELYPGSE
ncbi:MAG: TolC family protein [Candidatus Kapaibacterium sp.]